MYPVLPGPESGRVSDLTRSRIWSCIRSYRVPNLVVYPVLPGPESGRVSGLTRSRILSCIRSYPVPDLQRVDDDRRRPLCVLQQRPAAKDATHRVRLVDDDDEVFGTRRHRLDVERPEIMSKSA